MKKITSVLMVIAICASMATTVFAVATPKKNAIMEHTNVVIAATPNGSPIGYLFKGDVIDHKIYAGNGWCSVYSPVYGDGYIQTRYCPLDCVCH